MELDIRPLFTMVIFTHFFKIIHPTPRVVQILLKFCSKYVLMGYTRDERGRQIYGPVKVFAARVAGNSEFRFHIGQLEAFMKVLELNAISKGLYILKIEDMYRPEKIDIRVNDGWVPRGPQDEAIKFVIDESIDDNRSRLVAIPTGQGKTFLSLYCISILNYRTVVLILPSYIAKWCSDITKILNVKPKEIMPIQGSDQLKGLIDLANEGQLTSKFIVISLATLKNFFKAYELYGSSYTIDEYGCVPEDLFKIIKAGNLIIDEVHQHLHAVYKSLMYTHIPKVIALSATFMSDDVFITNIQRMMFPKSVRFDKIAMKKYIRVRAISYHFADIRKVKVKTTQFRSNTYSHHEYEKSILHNYVVLKNYLELINHLVQISYLDEYRPGDKLAVYASSINMCNEITKYLKQKYKHLDVRRYVEGDPYENVIDSDIRVTTILKSGAAIDIPGLIALIMTINIQSPVANLQILGRLREIKDRDVKFYYIYCDQIPKQVEYHKKKMELFEPKAASIKEMCSPISI